MKTYSAGQPARYGVYFAPRHLDVRVVGAEDEVLEGKDNARYFRIPTVLLVAACPAIGGAFVLLFPLVILGALAVVAFQECRKLVRHTADGTAHLAQMRWQPGAAYLDGNEAEPAQPAAAPTAGPPTAPHPLGDLADLEAEVRARREEER